MLDSLPVVPSSRVLQAKVHACRSGDVGYCFSTVRQNRAMCAETMCGNRDTLVNYDRQSDEKQGSDDSARHHCARSRSGPRSQKKLVELRTSTGSQSPSSFSSSSSPSSPGHSCTQDSPPRIWMSISAVSAPQEVSSR